MSAVLAAAAPVVLPATTPTHGPTAPFDLPRTTPPGWSSPELQNLFAEKPPVFVSPALGLESGLVAVGGGRGYVAAKAAPAGALLLVEQPLLAPPADGGDPVDALAALCGRDDGARRCVARLHPRSNTNGDERARLAKVWRCNGFESGVYAYRSLFNDAPDPNCVHFASDDGTAEIWTARPVRAGEPLTLDYAGGSGARGLVARAHGLEPEPLDDLDEKLSRAIPLLEAKQAALEQRRAKDLAKGPAANDVAGARHRRLAAELLEQARFVAERARSTRNRRLEVRALAVAGDVHALASVVYAGREHEAPRDDDDNRPDASRLRGDALHFAARRLDRLPADHPDVAAAAGDASDALAGLAALGAPVGCVAASLRGTSLRPSATPADGLLGLALALRRRADRSAALYDSARWLAPH